MATYAIGDIQGCFDPLQRLLDQVHFDPNQDTLWFTGDLVNRGPQSLETLRFIKSLKKSAITVLGNHDITLLAVASQAIPYQTKHHTFSDILEAPDRESLIEWLKAQPLLHYDPASNYVLVHAGLYPQWELPQALSYAKEVELALQSPTALEFLSHLYGNEPRQWNEALTGFDRLRFITNSFTRMRFCNLQGELELTCKENIDAAPTDYHPWFALTNRRNTQHKILFGHWAALKGHCSIPNVFALDTGCAWGNGLTALRLDDQQRFLVNC